MCAKRNFTFSKPASRGNFSDCARRQQLRPLRDGEKVPWVEAHCQKLTSAVKTTILLGCWGFLGLSTAGRAVLGVFSLTVKDIAGWVLTTFGLAFLDYVGSAGLVFWTATLPG
ncbi:hypothetical protein M9H77_17225 [Catharanthus roseus]|uniref:Uncharacterized protein n=1 Tax=Catharanthus roseus TaxID=4058 RepID=A0ACC0B479_CATRO|nr:hypothetical protein M9H77_17225 [Catharanthus roseus]